MIIDSHCHIDFSDFDNDRADVLQRAKDANIEKIIVAGISKKTWPRLNKTCQEHENLFACYGLHPYFLEQHEEQHLDDLKKYLKNNECIALGECGLDFYLKDLNKDKQQFFFEAQLDIAVELNLPVVIHSRKANHQILQALKKRPGLRGMVHSFSGSIEVAEQFIKQDFYISLGAIVTFEKATKIRALAKKLPLDALLVESDSPDQSGLKYYQQRNEPAFIVETIKVLADIKGVDFEVIAESSQKNAVDLFSF